MNSAAAKVAQEQRAFLSFTVNGVDQGQVLAIIRQGDILVPFADLRRAGLNEPNARIEIEDGTSYVSLRALAPGIGYTFNDRDLSLKLVAQPQYLGTATIDLQNLRPSGITYTRNASAFFNYALDWSNFNSLSEFSELGVSSQGNLYYTGFSIEPGGRFVRGLTNATFDNPDLMKRWVVGDTFASGGLLGGNEFIGGISLSRDFGLNPYFVQYPGVSISGQVLTPSTAQVFVNGHLVSTQPLAPGSFDIANIPVVAGGGNAQVVLRDAFGRTQTLTSPYYYSTAVLARGLSQYSYNLGAERFNVGSQSADYGPVVFIGQDRTGITDWFTAGARLDGGAGLVSGGPTASFRLGHGQLGIETALSTDHGLTGGAAQIDYSYQNRYLSYGGSLAAVGANYATASLSPSEDRTTRLATVFTGFSIGPEASLTASYTASQLRDSGTRDIAALTGSVQLSRKFDLVASADSMAGTAMSPQHQYVLSLSYALGPDVLAAVSQQGGSAGSGAGVSAEHSLPLGTGVGYLFSYGTGSEIRSNDYLQVQTSYGLYQASYLNANGSSQKEVLASGGLVDAGDGIMITRAVENGFAVIDVPGVRGVRGYYNNQLIGWTDGKGRLLVPNLLAYYGNRLEIAEQDIPLAYSVGATEETVAPPYRGGSFVRFAVKREMAVTGTVVVTLGRSGIVPAFGELHLLVGARPIVTELNAEGTFFLEDVRAGRYNAQVEYANGSCIIQIDVPRTTRAVTSLGQLACTSQQVGGIVP